MPTGQRLESVGRRVWIPAVLCALLFVLYLLGQYGLPIEYQQITENMLITLVLVIGLQVFSGNSGILSFGHVAFMAVGAYVSALLTIPPEIKKITFTSMPGFLHWILATHLGTIESTLIGGLCAAVLALVFAAPIVRLSGVAAGIATLALLVIVYTFNIQTTSITRGSGTMIGVPATTTTASALIWAFLAIIVAYVYQGSRRGVRLRGSRENEAAAKSVGINVPVERGVAWVLSAFIMGVGGALYAHYLIAFSADQFYFDITFTLVLMLVIGGLTSVSGAVIGTVFITVVQEVLRRIENGPLNGNSPGLTELVLAAILVLVLVRRPRGLTAGHEIPWLTDWHRPIWRGGGPAKGGESPRGEAAATGGQSMGDTSSVAMTGVAEPDLQRAPPKQP